MSRIFLLIFGLLLPTLASSQSIDFPPPPAGHVLDAGDWLGPGRKARLEQELGRYRRNHDLNVLVVLWNRGLPPGTTLEALAARLGETWAHHGLWAIILHVPDSLQRPVVVAGNRTSRSRDDEAIALAVSASVSRGMKERSTRARIESLALEVGEELAFLKNRAAHQNGQVVSNKNLPDPPDRGLRLPMLPGALIPITLALLLIGVIAVIYLLRRRTTGLFFPETHWRRRLGAPWGGGPRIIVSVPPRTS